MNCLEPPWSHSTELRLYRRGLSSRHQRLQHLFGGTAVVDDKAGGIGAQSSPIVSSSPSPSTLDLHCPSPTRRPLKCPARWCTPAATACTKVTAYTMSKATWEKSIICEVTFSSWPSTRCAPFRFLNSPQRAMRSRSSGRRRRPFGTTCLPKKRNEKLEHPLLLQARPTRRSMVVLNIVVTVRITRPKNC